MYYDYLVGLAFSYMKDAHIWLVSQTLISTILDYFT